MRLKKVGSIKNLQISLKREGGGMDSQLSKLASEEKKYSHTQSIYILMVPSHFIRI